MNLVRFPASRVIEINAFILSRGPGNKGAPDKGKLEGALSRIDNAIVYEDLSDIFEIAAKYAKVIVFWYSARGNHLRETSCSNLTASIRRD